MTKITPLTKAIGATVEGIDLSTTIDNSVQDKLRKAFLDHSVLLFPGQQLSHQQQLAAANIFGEPGQLHRPREFQPKAYSDLPDGIMMVSNIREDGVPIGSLPDGEMMFHHDMIHREIPDKATMLYAVEIPSFGGDTWFASGYSAYDSLPPEWKKRLDGLKASHLYHYGSTQKGDDRGTPAFGECTHPIIRTNHETGRKSIYVNRLMTESIEGLSPEDSQEILDYLFDHGEQPEHIYKHSWTVGDLLIWDNRCSMHARTDFPSGERRLLFRTTITDNQRPA
ncbi:TauD/TfdA family dioxygenase [Litorivicinus sp.]|nr:TauD/TfdA family dioxygenase [Litorivicinus sp.]MDC1209208.1 TauD/TfdA family dioxygenase [Litorivicinus sp.]